jgi:predicted HicB family RNase H-like nuclease
MMTYKDYHGTVTYDDEAEIFHGEVMDLRDVVTFQGRSVEELKIAFRESVDDYLEFCQERGEEPDKPYSGKFVLRVDPQLHRQLSLLSSTEGTSLNRWVVDRLSNIVEQYKEENANLAKP